MIVHCNQCTMWFDDEFRNTTCPHAAFLANDGQNNFKVHDDAYLNKEPPFNVDDLVDWNRMEDVWVGSYKIEKVYRPGVYLIRNQTEFIDLVPQNSLKRCVSKLCEGCKTLAFDCIVIHGDFIICKKCVDEMCVDTPSIVYKSEQLKL